MSMFTRVFLLATAAVALLPGGAEAAITTELHTTILGGGLTPRDAGDVNGDGRGDVLVRLDDTPAWAVVLGAAEKGTVDVRTAGPRVLTIKAPPYSSWVEPVGDVNGDGRDDIGVGQISYTDQGNLPSYVVFGRGAGTVDPAALGTGGLVFTAAGFETQRLIPVGDVNGDGRADIGFLGRLPRKADGLQLDVAAVAFGRAAPGAIDAGRPGAGFLIGSSAAKGYDGATLASVGDVNRDGKADLLVDVSPGNRARTVLVYGRGADKAVIDVEKLGTDGVDIPGQASIINAWPGDLGDFNGDGLSDRRVEWPVVSGKDTITFSSRTAVLYDLVAPVSRGLTLLAPAPTVGTGATGTAGNLVGDDLNDLLVDSTYYPAITGRGISRYPTSVYHRSAVVPGTTATASVNVETASSVAHLDALPADQVSAFRLQRNPSGTRQLVTRRDTSGIYRIDSAAYIYDVVDRPGADATPPVVTRFGFDVPLVENDCGRTCPIWPGPAEAHLRPTVNEAATVELKITWSGNGQTVATGKAIVPAGQFPFSFSPIKDPPVLPAGRYTATLVATDLAGNKAAPVTATVTVR
ncbi:MAG: VCBS repeat-containing protein [Solirubrobacteraceae bacterium]|nr:VCBS repeat-containing protein [Solirubrobacteraceae bacterium]